MPSKGNTLLGSQGLKLPHVPLPHLTVMEQLTTCDALVNLVTTEIISHMTPKNVVEEMFYDPPSYILFPIPICHITDN